MDQEKIKTLIISKEESIKQTMLKLNTTSSKILLIVEDNGKLIGIVTDGDLRRGILSGRELSDPIKKVMPE